ncbi:MAG: GDSL-type esterase/lipase family protein, partial [Verrucomicrobiota bacterium]
VACVGDSITYGAAIQDRERNCYPAQLGRALGEGYEVRNFGVNGATLLKEGDEPYWETDAYQEALAFNPHIVVIKLGTNDTKPHNWTYKADFAADTSAMIDAFRALDPKVRIYLCKPVPAFPARWGIRDEVIRNEVLPLIDQVAKEKNVNVIDLYTALEGKKEFFPDRIHPNADGAAVMAEVIAKALKAE